jgi:hypothetical protein
MNLAVAVAFTWPFWMIFACSTRSGPRERCRLARTLAATSSFTGYRKRTRNSAVTATVP